MNRNKTLDKLKSDRLATKQRYAKRNLRELNKFIRDLDALRKRAPMEDVTLLVMQRRIATGLCRYIRKTANL